MRLRQCFSLPSVCPSDLRDQPGRHDKNDGISVLVGYCAALERYFKAAIISKYPEECVEGSRDKDLSTFYHGVVIKHTAICLDTIADIIDGPNTANQQIIAEGPLLEVLSRLLDAIDLRHTDLFTKMPDKAGKMQPTDKPVRPYDYTIGRQTEHINVLDRIIFVLTSLMEGPPDKMVQERVLDCIKWQAFAQLLWDMYVIIRGEPHSRSLRRFSDRAVMMFSIATELVGSSVIEDMERVQRILAPVFSKTEMKDFFRDRLCSVEAVKESVQNDVTVVTMQKVFFPKPMLYVTKSKQLEQSIAMTGEVSLGRSSNACLSSHLHHNYMAGWLTGRPFPFTCAQL